MTPALHKFPSTPHLAWLGGTPLRDDKILTGDAASALLAQPLEIEEKVDGANLGISFDASGAIRFQNRGNWLDGRFAGQWERLRGWAAHRLSTLRECLPPDHVLFGEWCYAKHTVPYDRLPDWFVGFDVYDPAAGRFWSVARRNELLERAGLATVPTIAGGRFALADLVALLDSRSAFGAGCPEGLYVRATDNGWLAARAKIVRPGFVQQILDHWSSRPIVPNRLAPHDPPNPAAAGGRD